MTKKPEIWPEFWPELKDRRFRREDYEQQWDFEPPHYIPSDALQPWYVAGYSYRAVMTVLDIDYGAQKTSRSDVVMVPGGSLRYVSLHKQFHGCPRKGTLFVLYSPYGYEPTLARIVDTAVERELDVRWLISGNRPV